MIPIKRQHVINITMCIVSFLTALLIGFGAIKIDMAVHGYYHDQMEAKEAEKNQAYAFNAPGEED